MKIRTMSISLATAAVCAAACGGNDLGPGDGAVTNVQVSFSTQRNPSPYLSLARLDDTTIVNADTLIVTSAQIVLREVELQRAETVTCDTVATTNDCEEFEAGPFLVNLPTSSGTVAAFSLDIPVGVYDEVEFEIHKVDGGDDRDSAFVAANPSFDQLSIKVVGRFNGQPFEFTSDLNVEQELALNPALTIDDNSEPTNLTILVDLDRWFRDPTGALVDPSTGNKGGANEGLVKENIKNAIEAFEDDDRDGVPSS